jgi:hypothetical protein
LEAGTWNFRPSTRWQQPGGKEQEDENDLTSAAPSPFPLSRLLTAHRLQLAAR